MTTSATVNRIEGLEQHLWLAQKRLNALLVSRSNVVPTLTTIGDQIALVLAGLEDLKWQLADAGFGRLAAKAGEENHAH